MRVAAALSGGVDSSVSAFLLKQAGYDVVGVSFFHRYLNTDASHIAEKLNIPYLRVDIDAAFKEYVVDYFIGEYLSGRTPNPCVWCNRRIKFGLFRQLALQLADAELFATGHYVSLLECGETRFLSKNEDPEYEQSYFLCYLTQDELAKTIFPLSTMNKKEVRRIAQEQALPTSINRSSRDICFAQEGYRALFAGSSVPPGDIVDVEGRKIGEHNGIFNYTIGQKKGLGTARQMSGGGEPLYVLRIEPKENRIVVAPLNLLYKKEIQVEKINYVGFEPPDKPLLVQTRIRYRQPDESATLIPVSEDGAIVIFDRPVFAPTAGQFAVFFCGRLLLGGGVIKG